jgi:hypothetical protein
MAMVEHPAAASSPVEVPLVKLPLSPQEVFETYVATALQAWQRRYPDFDMGWSSNVRALFEAHGEAVATVLAGLQRRPA